jgi:hypothetical protein
VYFTQLCTVVPADPEELKKDFTLAAVGALDTAIPMSVVRTVRSKR